MSAAAVSARRKQFAEKMAELDTTSRFGPRREENTYARLHPALLLVLAFVVCLGVAAIYRNGGRAGHHELLLRFEAGLVIWAVPVVLVVLPCGIRHLLQRRALRVAAAHVRCDGAGIAVPAAIDGHRGLLAAQDHGLVLLTASGGRQQVTPWDGIAVACQFIPRHPLWSLPGADLQLRDGGWVEVRAVDVRPVLGACRKAGVRVLPAVNVIDLRTW